MSTVRGNVYKQVKAGVRTYGKIAHEVYGNNNRTNRAKVGKHVWKLRREGNITGMGRIINEVIPNHFMCVKAPKFRGNSSPHKDGYTKGAATVGITHTSPASKPTTKQVADAPYGEPPEPPTLKKLLTDIGDCASMMSDLADEALEALDALDNDSEMAASIRNLMTKYGVK